MDNAKTWLQWCKAGCHYTLEQGKYVLLLAIWWTIHGLVEARTTLLYLLEYIVLRVKSGEAGFMFEGCFLKFVSLSVLGKCNVNATAYKAIQSHCKCLYASNFLATGWEMQHGNAVVNTVASQQEGSSIAFLCGVWIFSPYSRCECEREWLLVSELVLG